MKGTARALAQELIDEKAEALLDEMEQWMRDRPESNALKHMAYYMAMISLERLVWKRAMKHQTNANRMILEEMTNAKK